MLHAFKESVLQDDAMSAVSGKMGFHRFITYNLNQTGFIEKVLDNLEDAAKKEIKKKM